MSELRKKMIKAMELRNFSPRTHTAYLSAVTNLAKHYKNHFRAIYSKYTRY